MEVRLLDGYQYADSFLAQRLRLPRAEGAPRGVVIIGLDTNQAGSLVSTWDTLMGRSPGTTGHIHPDQQAVCLFINGKTDSPVADRPVRKRTDVEFQHRAQGE